MTVYTGVYDDTADVPTEDGTELICSECGWTYTGTYCDVCTPCDDCGLIPALCWCEGYSRDIED